MPKHKTSAPAQDQKPAKRFKPDYSETLTILAGEDERQITVHKNILCNSSPYFATASLERWQQEGEEGIVRLRCVDASTFTLYVHWIYSGEIDLDLVDVICNHEEKPCKRHKCTTRSNAHHQIKLYIAGDLLIDPALRNSTMDKIVEHIWHHSRSWEPPFTWAAIDEIWNTTSDHQSPLRKCVLDYYVAAIGPKGLAKCAEGKNPQFILDFANKLLKGREEESRAEISFFNTRKCDYHVHLYNETCLGKEAESC